MEHTAENKNQRSDPEFNQLYPKVSIVIPTYNRSELLMKAIKSIKNQNYSNLEIIIVDDCSADDTAQVVANINDDQIIYIQHEVNQGGAEARNTGIRYASGEFIAFLDSDDQWLPGKLEKQLKIFKGNSDIGVVYTGMKFVNDTQTLNEITPVYKGRLLSKLMESNFIGTTSSVVIRKELLQQINGFNSSLPSCQDWDLYLRLAQITYFDFVKESLVLYFQHSGEQISTNNKAVINGHISIYNDYKKLAKLQGKEVFQKFNINIAKIIFRTGIVSKDKGSVKLARRILNEGFKESKYTSMNLIWYFTTFINLKSLQYFYKYSKKVSYDYYSFSK